MLEDSSTDYSEPGSNYFKSNDNNSNKSISSVNSHTFVEDSSFFGAFESELANNGLGNGAIDPKRVRGTERHFKNLLVRKLTIESLYLKADSLIILH